MPSAQRLLEKHFNEAIVNPHLVKVQCIYRPLHVPCVQKSFPVGILSILHTTIRFGDCLYRRGLSENTVPRNPLANGNFLHQNSRFGG